MLVLKINYADGDEVITRFNGTVEEAERYYNGKVFNIGSVVDNLQKCNLIEILER